MNARPDPEHRHEPTDAVPNPRDAEPSSRESAEYVSTRILLSAHSDRHCHACGTTIDQRTRYKCLTVRSSAGEVIERNFCGAACLDGRR